MHYWVHQTLIAFCTPNDTAKTLTPVPNCRGGWTHKLDFMMWCSKYLTVRNTSCHSHIEWAELRSSPASTNYLLGLSGILASTIKSNHKNKNAEEMMRY